jgi:hypothetical protein
MAKRLPLFALFALTLLIIPICACSKPAEEAPTTPPAATAPGASEAPVGQTRTKAGPVGAPR